MYGISCKACQRTIEDVNMDPILELCNRCYSISRVALEELLDETEDKPNNKPTKKKIKKM